MVNHRLGPITRKTKSPRRKATWAFFIIKLQIKLLSSHMPAGIFFAKKIMHGWQTSAKSEEILLQKCFALQTPGSFAVKFQKLPLLFYHYNLLIFIQMLQNCSRSFNNTKQRLFSHKAWHSSTLRH